MAVLYWLVDNWFELGQTIFGGGLIFFAYNIRKDVRSRRISNLIAINGQHGETWKIYFDIPDVERVMSEHVNLEKIPVSTKERIYTNKLILNLSISFRAMQYGELVKFEGLLKDVRGFFSLPIPKNVWSSTKLLQDEDFVEFVESALK